MVTYNGLIVPERIRTCMIISAFQNEIDYEKLEKYTEVMKEEMLSNSFPPIKGFPSIITEEDFDNEFLTGESVTKEHLGMMGWFVTDGHHRSLSAIEASVPYLLRNWIIAQSLMKLIGIIFIIKKNKLSLKLKTAFL